MPPLRRGGCCSSVGPALCSRTDARTATSGSPRPHVRMPRSHLSDTQSSAPCAHARCSGVSLLSVFAFDDAPKSNSVLINTRCPPAAARCIGVSQPPPRSSTRAPALTSTRAVSTHPCNPATCPSPAMSPHLYVYIQFQFVHRQSLYVYILIFFFKKKKTAKEGETGKGESAKRARRPSR